MVLGFFFNCHKTSKYLNSLDWTKYSAHRATGLLEKSNYFWKGDPNLIFPSLELNISKHFELIFENTIIS